MKAEAAGGSSGNLNSFDVREDAEPKIVGSESGYDRWEMVKMLLVWVLAIVLYILAA